MTSSTRALVLAAALLAANVAPAAHAAELAAPRARAAAVAGAVASEHPQATAIGLAVLAQGGNAIDAAIATAYAVCVLNLSSCGIGGGGFMLVHEASGRVHALDYRETAPALAHRDLYRRDDEVLGELARRGGLAVGVPGEVAGLEAARSRFARLPRATLLAPAIALARDGFPVGPHLASQIARQRDAIRSSPGVAALLLHPDGRPLAAGDVLRAPDLARTLERVAAAGTDGFYRGPVAAAIAGAVGAAGGILTTADLAAYRVRWREPLRARYRGHEMFTMPPPSSGGVLLAILHTLAGDDLAALGRTSPAYLHLLAEAMTHGFADRARWYGDPAFAAVPIARLIAPAYGRALRARIDPERTQPPPRYGTAPDAGTAHLSVMDAEGNAVGCTTTINTAFGAMLVGGESGVLLNNEMDDFAIAPGVPNAFGLVGGEANAVAPGKRPLSSMAPVIVLRGGRPRLVAGGSGGPLILSATLQTVLGVLDFDLDVAAAIAAPRIHQQWMPPALALEEGFPAATREALAARGHTLAPLPPIGAVQAVGWHDGRLTAAADPRKGGVGVTR